MVDDGRGGMVPVLMGSRFEGCVTAACIMHCGSRARPFGRHRWRLPQRHSDAAALTCLHTRFFEHFIDELRARPLTLEILAAEVSDRNELTAILETEREQWGEEASRALGGAEFAALPQARASSVLLVAGVQYLLVRARKIRVFSGIELDSDAGWAVFKASLRMTAQLLLAPERGGSASALPKADGRRKLRTKPRS